MKTFCLTAISIFIFTQIAYGQDLDFTPVQTDLFGAPGAQSNAWADYDKDGDLDLVVTFRAQPVRLYKNTDGTFEDVGAASGLPTDGGNMRGVAWGDYDLDGDLDLYFGYADVDDPPDRLYRNDGGTFVDATEDAGIRLKGITGQVSFVDYDSDGDVDLYVAFREFFNRMLRNDGGVFKDVTFASGLAEIRRTVGACWFDMDADGDLDLFTANQNGDRDGMFRNNGDGTFTDIALELDMDQPRRPVSDGSVGCAVTDFDNDGHLDLYVAEYGHDSLYRSNGDGTFTDVAEVMGVDVVDHIVTGAWGDVDHNGYPDLYVASFVSRRPKEKDYFFMNLGDRFDDKMPQIIQAHDADHGVQFADYDGDGDLDLALAANDAQAGSHYLFRNDLADDIGRRSIQVLVLDENGFYTRAGAEVRVYKAGTDNLLGLRMVDTGTGYKSQNAMAVHVGLPDLKPVDIVVTTMSPNGRRDTRIENVDPAALQNKPLEIRAK